MKSGNGINPITIANKLQPIDPVGFLSHFLIESIPPNFIMKNSQSVQPIRIIGMKAHFPMMGPNVKAAPKFAAIIKKGDAITIFLLVNFVWIGFIGIY